MPSPDFVLLPKLSAAASTRTPAPVAAARRPRPCLREDPSPLPERAAPTRRANAARGLRPSSASSGARGGSTPRQHIGRPHSDDTRSRRSGVSEKRSVPARPRRSRRPLASVASLFSARPRPRAVVPARPAAGPARRPCTGHGEGGRRSSRGCCMRPKAVMARRRGACGRHAGSDGEAAGPSADAHRGAVRGGGERAGEGEGATR